MSSGEQPASSHEKGTGWGQNRRLEFIDFRLLWEGHINRSDLTDFFGISVPQASLDIARYQEMAPNNVEYDKKEKEYVATANFEPLITPGDSFLNSLLAVNLGMMSREMSFIGWYPNFGAVLSPNRKIEPRVLFHVLEAIRKNLTLEIEYQSLTRLHQTTRKVSPHAIAYDGFRWHTRAYCHEHDDFRDFVFARILKIGEKSPSTADQLKDAAWHNVLDLVLAPHPDLPPAQKRIIELDYGMRDGTVVVVTRQALLFYMLRRLGLDKNAEKSAQAQQIILVNEKELRPYIKAVE
jgi:hypothetical protein